MNPIRYLFWIYHRQLPMKVSTPQEIRLVSALTVAGLVEARMVAAPDARGRYWPAAEATIFALTEEGLKVLFEYIAEKRVASGRLFSGSELPIEYLREISDSPFPLRVEEHSALKNIDLLQAVGFLEATVTRPGRIDASNGNWTALVLRITPLGRRALHRNAT